MYPRGPGPSTLLPRSHCDDVLLVVVICALLMIVHGPWGVT